MMPASVGAARASSTCGVGRAAPAPSKRMSRTAGRHCSRTKYSWNASVPAIGLDHGAHRVVRHRQDARRDAERAARCAQMRGQRLAGRRRRVRSTCVARSPSPSLNQVGPPSSPSAPHEGPGLVAPAPAGLGVDDAGQRIERGVDVGRDVQAQVLEVVAGVDDDGRAARPAAAPGRATAWRRRRRPTAPRRCRSAMPRAHRNRSSALGRTSAAAGRVGRAPVEPAHQRGGTPLGGLAHGQHGGGRHRIGEPDLGHLQRAPATGPSRRAGPTATARRPRRWRAPRCRAARPGRRCRRRSRRCRRGNARRAAP